MAEDKKSESTAPGQQGFTVPSVSLPKGGGAIRGIGEKFAANAVTGTGAMTVPIATSPGRSSFGPQFTLSYESGSGNGPFGFGWSLSLPAITRKTDKGLPQYQDANESDVFILSGAEDLVPVLEADGTIYKDETTVSGYIIHRYRPRIEGLFARIERWTNQATGEAHWRSITKDNITTLYGGDNNSRIFDPQDPNPNRPRRVFSWLICQSYDDKGNAIVYEYKAENSENIDLSQANEQNRTDVGRSASRYLKGVKYGNRTPNRDATWQVIDPSQLSDWMFELVFDYGDGHYSEDAPDAQGRIFAHSELTPPAGSKWPVRQDPFSNYRGGFEVRTYRLCHHVLMFHHFPEELGTIDYLVRSTELIYTESPIASFITGVTQSGYVLPDLAQPKRYLKKSLPALEFSYSQVPDAAQLAQQPVEEVDADSLENLPIGLDGRTYQWVDLDGEGTSGVFTEQADGWYYKRNLSPNNQIRENGSEHTVARLGKVELISARPAAGLADGHAQFLDLSGDGQVDLVQMEGSVRGFYERTEEAEWAPFRPFVSWPNLNTREPNLKFVDVTGDGHADILITEDAVFTWYPSLAEEGFGPAERTHQSFDEEKGPHLVFADGTQSIYLADLSGDGLTDLVRIRNGEVCYWPNLGYGRFGTKVTMDSSPWFDPPDLFNQERIRLADTDGSGTTDIIYLGREGAQIFFNQSGNRWSAAVPLRQFPQIDNIAAVQALDLLGNGTACLVWSSPLPGNAGRPMRYIALMDEKPHLLVMVKNNLGAETHIHYAPSTKFYLNDKQAGKPWVTRLPFPVHVVERTETYDWISRNRFVTRYAYHHGYFDGIEREFRGFGMVEQQDTEELGALSQSGTFPDATNIDAASYVPPVLTKTWFHTGAYFGEERVSKHFEEEYYHEGDATDAITGLSDAQLGAMLLNDTVLPSTIRLPDGSRISYALSAEETREACRALRGSILRQEIYALDNTDEADRPYSASERNYTIEVLQPQGPNRYAVFFAHSRETIDFLYERKLFKVDGGTLTDPNALPPARDAADPRVTHAITLAVDSFGNILQSVAVGYGRRYLDPDLTQTDQTRQGTTLCTYTENSYTNAVLESDAHRTPLPAQFSTYELIQVQPDATQADVTNVFRFEELQTKVQAAGDGHHDIPYENPNPTGLQAGSYYRRLIKQMRNYYRPDDMGASAGNPKTLLPLGALESLALPGESYKMAITPGQLSLVYQRASTALLTTPASVLGSTGANGGGYVDLDSDGHWWVPSGRIFYSLNASDNPTRELANAQLLFFLPRRFRDPFANDSTISYDANNLLVIETEDALHNKVTAGERARDGGITNRNDCRVLQPSLVTDANGNRSVVAFDALGLVAGTAVMGKAFENPCPGDSLTNFTADLAQSAIDRFFSSPTTAFNLLVKATTRIVYDIDRFQRTSAANPTDPTQWEPVFAATIVRETHVSDLAANQQTKLQVSFSYSDGFGREIQKKIQAEPGPLTDGGADVTPRWVASGWTIFNNKGKPVRQYEPFFDDTHDFKFGVTIGVSPILFYDPVERMIATVHPNQTYEKVVFDPWRQDIWDANDTVLIPNASSPDPSLDADVGVYFQRLPLSDYFPTWYAQRINGGLTSDDQDAARKTTSHANSPTVAYFDTLGRTFLTVADNGLDQNNTPQKYCTLIELDIQGFRRSVTDALNRKVMTYDYDLLGTKIHQTSVDAGERWMLNDVLGKPLLLWNSRGFQLQHDYDILRRPIHLCVLQSGNSGLPQLAERTVYGETHPDSNPSPSGAPAALALNLRGKVFQQCDGAGVVTNNGYDFKNNLLGSARQLLKDYQDQTDWSVLESLFAVVLPATLDLTTISATLLPLLESDTFTTNITYDALNRPVTLTSPDGSVTVPTYNERRLLQALSVTLAGSSPTTPTPSVTEIEYNPKGQRKSIAYGNGASTTYEYDLQTFRLLHLYTARAAASYPGDDPNPPNPPRGVQNLRYTYDPVGNITRMEDNAQQTVYFSNQVVTPSNDYTYDPIYRLTAALGREHIGQVSQPQTTRDDSSRMNQPIPNPNDGPAMRNYKETYLYDPVGNFEKLVHSATNGNWTRSYAYDEPNPIPTNNHLTSTTVGGITDKYGIPDADGNMEQMPHLSAMAWDFKDQLQMTQQQVVNDGPAPKTYYVYDASGQRVRKVNENAKGTKANERIYLGGYEVYREYGAATSATATQPTTLERQTIHVMDDKQRIALVETLTQGSDGSPKQLIRCQFGNHLGSASLELDEKGNVISYEEYYPYGTTSYQAVDKRIKVAAKRYRYTGKERDEETGFSCHGSRYYAPWIGCWTSSDQAGLVDGTNLYAYARLNPIRYSDPNGTDSKPSPLALPNTSANGAEFLQRVSSYIKPNPNVPVEFSDRGANVVIMRLPEPYVVQRGSGEKFTDAAKKADTSKDSETVVNTNLYESTTTAPSGIFSPADASDYRAQGEVVQGGSKIGGRSSPETFNVAWTQARPQQLADERNDKARASIAPPNPSDAWQFGRGDPPKTADVAFGGALPVIINGLPYGNRNEYVAGAPTTLPAKGDPGAGNEKLLTQRSNAGFADQEARGSQLGKVVMGVNRDVNLLVIVVEQHGASPGLNLSDIRNSFVQMGVKDAVAWDGSDSATLVRDATVVSSPGRMKDNTIPFGIGFRLR